MSYYGDLIHKLKSRSRAKLVFTSLLPRLVGHYKTQKTITKVNAELKVLCRRKHFLFCNLYKHFLYKNSPDPTLFAPSDGLYLFPLVRKNKPPSKTHTVNGKKIINPLRMSGYQFPEKRKKIYTVYKMVEIH
jgi:hypothetical protein